MELVTYPSSILGTVCTDTVHGSVFDVDHDLKNIIEKMADVMYTSHGIGLASPQVGLHNRIILVDPSGGMSENEFVAMINPKFTWLSHEKEENEEGCLSLPGVFVKIIRSLACDVEFYDIIAASTRTMRCTGLKARIVQHETEHLDGILTIDKLGPIARRAALHDLKVHT